MFGFTAFFSDCFDIYLLIELNVAGRASVLLNVSSVGRLETAARCPAAHRGLLCDISAGMTSSPSIKPEVSVELGALM